MLAFPFPELVHGHRGDEMYRNLALNRVYLVSCDAALVSCALEFVFPDCRIARWCLFASLLTLVVAVLGAHLGFIHAESEQGFFEQFIFRLIWWL
jgi:hypothetical protein